MTDNSVEAQRYSDIEDSTAAPGTAPPGGNNSAHRSPVALLAMALALVAVALSAWAAFRPSPTENAAVGAPAQITDESRGVARQSVCDAFDTVRRGITINTNASAPGGPGDVAGGMAVAANARLALLGGGEYLLSKLEPAVPTDLGDATRTFATTLLDIGALSIAGIPTTDPAQTDRMRSADALSAEIAGLCGSA